MADLTLNSSGLQNLATQTGGVYYTADKLQDILNDLDGGQPIVRVIDEQFAFIKPWWVFALFFVAIVSEWLIRKKNNLC